MFLKISQKLTGKHLCRRLHFNEVARGASKETLAQVFSSCKFFKIFKKQLFKENVDATASG